MKNHCGSLREGADEVFAGYGIYREPSALAPLRGLPRPLRRPLYMLEKLLPPGMPGKNYLARSRRPLEERFLGNAYIFSPAEKGQISNLNINPSPFRVTDPLYRQVAGLDDITRMAYRSPHLDAGGHPGKGRQDDHGQFLELRVPYLDHYVFEFAATLPQEYKVRGKTTKRALREAFKDILPPSAINRPKRGFPVPTREWLKRPDFRRLFLELLAGEGGRWFQRNNVKKLLDDHREGKVEAGRKLWVILIFLLWHEAYNLKAF